jgi:hypothetical protein
MSKTCFKCRRVKPISEFYVHSQMADGHLGKCKDCTKLDVADRVEVKKHDPVWIAMERERCRIKSADARKRGVRWKTDPETSKRWRQRNRNKQHAHNVAAYAVKTGRIQKAEICTCCGLKVNRLHKHHPDYSRPLDIVWLCSSCHGMQHRKPIVPRP